MRDKRNRLAEDFLWVLRSPNHVFLSWDSLLITLEVMGVSCRGFLWRLWVKI